MHDLVSAFTTSLITWCLSDSRSLHANSRSTQGINPAKMADRNPQHNDVTRTDPQTLVRWIIDQQRKSSPDAKGNLSILLGSIASLCLRLSGRCAADQAFCHTARTATQSL